MLFTPFDFVVQEATPTDDGIGGYTQVWEDTQIVSGYLDLVNGTDLSTIQNALIEQSTHLLIIPGIPDKVITDKMRVVDGSGRFYNISYVDDPMGQGNHLEIYLSFGGEL